MILISQVCLKRRLKVLICSAPCLWLHLQRETCLKESRYNLRLPSMTFMNILKIFLYEFVQTKKHKKSILKGGTYLLNRQKTSLHIFYLNTSEYFSANRTKFCFNLRQSLLKTNHTQLCLFSNKYQYKSDLLLMNYFKSLVSRIM